MPDTASDQGLSQSVQTTLRPTVEITDQHKEDFFKAFLADRPYEEEFSLLGGHFKVKFKTLTMKENNALVKQLAFDKANNLTANEDFYFPRVAHYRLGLTLVSINDLPFADDLIPETIPANPKDGTSYVSARADRLAEWTMVKLAAIQSAMTEFDQRTFALLDGVSKPDFWKAGA